MNDKYEKVIRRQDELIACLEKQHAAGQELIDSQKQQIHALEEKISVLEKENRALASAGNEMSAACEKLEKICMEQQELISSFTNIFSG